MAGFPRLREHGWLYGRDPKVPLAHVRLLQGADGWDLYLSDPAADPPQHVHYADEAGARAELARIYAEGEKDGRWRIWRDGVEVDAD